jgi:hypothetical protein
MTAPTRRSQIARIGAHAMHATHDTREVSAPGRRAFLARFELEVDPNGELPEEERRRRARHALKAHMRKLALKSAEARRRGAA